LHQRVFDLFYTDAADDAFDQGRVRIELWGLFEEVAETGFFLDLFCEAGFCVTRQPRNNLVKLILRPAFRLNLLHIVRIYTRKTHGKNVQNDSGTRHQLEPPPQRTIFPIYVLLARPAIEDEHQNQPDREINQRAKLESVRC